MENLCTKNLIIVANKSERLSLPWSFELFYFWVWIFEFWSQEMDLILNFAKPRFFAKKSRKAKNLIFLFFFNFYVQKKPGKKLPDNFFRVIPFIKKCKWFWMKIGELDNAKRRSIKKKKQRNFSIKKGVDQLLFLKQ